jgi:N6-adenosine-specific RNA methylase IME4
MNNALAIKNRLQAELAQVTSLPDVKSLHDRAEALRLYCKKAGETREVQNDVAEVKLRAERRAGELLQGMDKSKGAAQKRTRCHDVTTLAELGIGKKQSSRWQIALLLPDEDFEAHIIEVKESPTGELTSAGVLRLARPLAKAKKRKRTNKGETCTVEDLHALVAAGKRYATVYADPPWAYDNQGTRAATGNHYETVTVDWLCEPENMPIEALGMDNAHLHLWTTNAFLFDAKRIIDAWGFEYKSCFVWVKPQMGIGNYWRVSHEFLLLGVRGKLTFEEHGQMSWGKFKRGKHSRKPDAIRKIIEKVSLQPRLELFGREAVKGWTVWGNDVRRDLLTLDVPDGP